MKPFPLLLVSCLLLLAIAHAAAAGVRPGAFTASLVADGYTFDGKQHLETRPVVGLRAGYNFTRRVSVEGLFDYVSTVGTLPGQGDADVFRYGGDVLFHFFPDGELVPYVAAGLGGINIERDDEPNGTRTVFDYGAGLKYFVTDDLAVRGDVRHLVLFDGEVLSNYEYTVGFLYQFGGRGPKPVEVAGLASPQPPPPPPPPSPPEPEPPAPEPPLEPPPAAEPAPDHYKYCVTLHVEFDIDRAVIRPESHDEIAKVGNFMKLFPSTTAVIEGHTDNVGSAEHNLALSESRAWSVVDYLADHFGIDRTRLSARGYGLTKPVADNATDAGKQQNRRIEAIIDCAFIPENIQPPERLCMQLRIEFEPGKADISPRFDNDIAAVAAYLKKYPTTTALIEGHTDNVGSPESNLKLSQRRAENVVDYMVKKFGVDRARLSARGYGSTRRIAYNSTPEGRQKNRRINAVIDCVIRK